MGVHCSGHFFTTGVTPGSAPATPGWTCPRIAIHPKALALTTWIYGHWEISLLCTAYSYFLSFSKAWFSICSWGSPWIYVCMYLCTHNYVFMLYTVQQSFLSMEEMQIDPGCSSQQLFVQKFLFFNSDVNENIFFPVLEIFLVWSGSGRIGMCLERTLEWEWVKAQFCSLGIQCWNITLCSVLVNRLEWRAKSDLRKLQHLLSGFKYFETSTPWDCFRIKWVMVQRKWVCHQFNNSLIDLAHKLTKQSLRFLIWKTNLFSSNVIDDQLAKITNATISNYLEILY